MRMFSLIELTPLLSTSTTCDTVVTNINYSVDDSNSFIVHNEYFLQSDICMCIYMCMNKHAYICGYY